MFLSKIWFFLIGVAAAIALSVALTMPRPAQRLQNDVVDPERVARARASTEMLLRENARKWIDLVSVFARVPAPTGKQELRLDLVLDKASKDDPISADSHKTAMDTLQYILSQVSGKQKPEFAVALDAWGRVVARAGMDEGDWGDDLSGYFLVRDALRGYLRDDLWFVNGQLYRVAAAPVIERDKDTYVGAVVLGDLVDMPLAKEIEKRVGRCVDHSDGSQFCEPHVAFFVKGQPVATSDSTPITKDIVEQYNAHKAELAQVDENGNPKPLAPFAVTAGDKSYLVALKQLPGEAGAQDGFYAVFAERSAAVGFMGTLKGVTKDDIGFKKFPWIPLIAIFLIAVALGMVAMWWESDRPLRRLLVDAVALGKGDKVRLEEEQHRGKFGSIARSVNIALEKLQRDAKSAKKDLGAVLGPPPEEGLFGASGARPLPNAPMGGGSSSSGSPFAPPPPSDFSFEPPASGPPKGNDLRLASGPIPSVGPPQGGGFDFEMAPPGPAAPPPPPIAARTPLRPNLPPIPAAAPELLAPPPLMPAMDQLKTNPAKPPARPSAPPPLPMPMTPPPRLPTTPAATRAAPPPALPALDDDILAPNVDEDMLSASSGGEAAPMFIPQGGARGDFGGATVVADPSEDLLRQASAGGEEAYFRQVFDDFAELKRKCGESTDGLTYEKFAAKLRANRDQLVAKYACKAVKFQVYVKDGKAALKATPVKS